MALAFMAEQPAPERSSAAPERCSELRRPVLRLFSTPSQALRRAVASLPGPAWVEGSDGNFYGATSRGGVSNKGTVYRITPAGVLTLLHSFVGAPTDGEYPLAGLLKASDGNFYGTTFIGGASNEGALFKITPAGVESVVHSFSSGAAVPRALPAISSKRTTATSMEPP